MKEVKVVVVRERPSKLSAGSICKPRDLSRLLHRRVKRLDREHFFVIHLDTRNVPLSFETVSIGTVSANLVHPREVMKGAILLGATSIIVAHNHPSGSIEPSDEDVELTKRLVKVCDIIGIPLMDHVILTAAGLYYSLREKTPQLFKGGNYNA